MWTVTTKGDPRALALAERHYNRQTPGSRQFCPPGQNLVLITDAGDAVWVTTRQRFQDHDWKGAWVCTLFRNESAQRSSDLIREAIRITKERWGEPPHGIITFVNPRKIRSHNPGCCFKLAGFTRVGTTRKHKLITLRTA
ncbi:MAG TPA: hypothetical protein VKX16_10380 [Chloroflexota bacterium]|nr:hypothetical protein [Chloroflexota bacterium]